MELRNEKEFFVCHGVCKGGGRVTEKTVSRGTASHKYFFTS
jgi:hypothetical protein